MVLKTWVPIAVYGLKGHCPGVREEAVAGQEVGQEVSTNLKLGPGLHHWWHVCGT